VSLPAFQSALARLVTHGALDNLDVRDDLTERERDRLQAIARSPGLAITRKLHRGFRLGKLLSMLPLTCACLGDDALASEATQFWRARPSRSFYFWEEALSFCDHLLDVGPARPYLPEIVRHERAVILLQCDPARLPDGRAALLWPVDPRPVLQALSSSQPIPELAPAPHLMVGETSPDGAVSWSLRR
jgi:hypothetical protein